MRTTYATGVVRAEPRPDATQLLLCVGYCGGSPAAFRPWAATVPPGTDLAMICYPGRERRMAEPLVTSWDALLADVLTAIRSVAGRPYVLAGHSMGARVAFDATLRLERSGGPAPAALVVSGSTAPSLPRSGSSPRSTATDDELLTWMSTVGQLSPLVLGDAELRRMALDVFRADMRASESQVFEPGSKINTPTQLLYGHEDADPIGVDREWAALVAGDFRYDELPGGHFYTPEVWAALPRHMAALSTN